MSDGDKIAIQSTERSNTERSGGGNTEVEGGEGALSRSVVGVEMMTSPSVRK